MLVGSVTRSSACIIRNIPSIWSSVIREAVPALRLESEVLEHVVVKVHRVDAPAMLTPVVRCTPQRDFPSE
jgi:hypothetical protein